MRRFALVKQRDKTAREVADIDPVIGWQRGRRQNCLAPSQRNAHDGEVRAQRVPHAGIPFPRAEGRADALGLGGAPKTLEEEIAELKSSEKVDAALAELKAASKKG